MLYMTYNGNNCGYAVSSASYFELLSKDLKNDFNGASASSLCEARKKISYKAFEYLLQKLQRTDMTWKGHRLIGVDGTKLSLPDQQDFREKFGVAKGGCNAVGALPVALMVCAYDVLSGQPLGARLQACYSSERDALYSLCDDIGQNSVFLLDRGYCGPRTMFKISESGSFFVTRQRSSLNGKYKKFFQSSKKDMLVEEAYKDESGLEQTIQVRLIKVKEANGHITLLATNLLCRNNYSYGSIVKLYLKRWGIETMYFRLKEYFKVTNFHARDLNGILQEIFSSLIGLSLTSLVSLSHEKTPPLLTQKLRARFKTAMELVRVNIHYWIEEKLRPKLKRKLNKILREIKRLKYRERPNRKYPRYSKTSPKPWGFAKKSKIENFERNSKMA